jgi:hypothetical protein
MDLVGDQAVCLTVHGVGGLRVRRFDQAEDLPVRLVHPVLAVVDAVLALDPQVLLVGLGDVLGLHARDIVDIHEQWHRVPLPSVPPRDQR